MYLVLPYCCESIRPVEHVYIAITVLSRRLSNTVVDMINQITLLRDCLVELAITNIEVNSLCTCRHEIAARCLVEARCPGNQPPMGKLHNVRQLYVACAGSKLTPQHLLEGCLK